MTKILHIALDDKFIDSANWQFEKIFPGSNKFYITTNNSNYSTKFVKISNNVIVLHENSKSQKQILTELGAYNLIVLHGLDDFQCQIILKANKDQKFLWLFWGYEVYNYKKEYLNAIYGIETRIHFIDKQKKGIKNFYLRQYFELVSRLKINSRFRAIKRINYFGTLIKEEFTKLKELKIINASFFRFSYYPIEYILEGYEESYILGNNILLGNSATPSNNHIEAFEIINKFNLEGRKVIVPLSYGDNRYRDELLKIGNILLNGSFIPLTEFLLINEYNKIIKKCSIFILNSYRQQGVGNIIAMLWMGAKVFLDERNTAYMYLKRIGCKVFSINKDMDPANENALSPLALSDIKTNREILKNELSKESLLGDLKKQLENTIIQ